MMKRRVVCSSLALILTAGIGYGLINSENADADSNDDVRIYYNDPNNLSVSVKGGDYDSMHSTANKKDLNTVYQVLGTPSEIESDVSKMKARDQIKAYYNNKVASLLDFIQDPSNDSGNANALSNEVKAIAAATDEKLDSANEQDLPDIVEEAIYGSDIAASSPDVKNGLLEKGRDDYLDENSAGNDADSQKLSNAGLVLTKKGTQHINNSNTNTSSSSSSSSQKPSSSSSSVKSNQSSSNSNNTGNNGGGNNNNNTGTSNVGNTNRSNTTNVGNSDDDQNNLHFNSVKALTDWFDEHDGDYDDNDLKGATVTVSNIQDVFNDTDDNAISFSGGHGDHKTSFFQEKSYPNVKNGDTVTVTITHMKVADPNDDDYFYDVYFSNLQEGNGSSNQNGQTNSNSSQNQGNGGGGGTAAGQNGVNGANGNGGSNDNGAGNGGSGSGTPTSTTNGAGTNTTLPQTGQEAGTVSLVGLSLAGVLAASMGLVNRQKKLN